MTANKELRKAIGGHVSGLGGEICSELVRSDHQSEITAQKPFKRELI